MDSAPESAAAAEPRPLPALRSSRVSFNRLFVVRYLLVGDILSINLDGNIYAFNITGPREASFMMPDGDTLAFRIPSGPHSLLTATGIVGVGFVNRNLWDDFAVYREGQFVGTLNQIREQFWVDSEFNRLSRARQAAGFSA